MAKMDDNFLDLTVTSPPYDNLRLYSGYSFDFESIAKELYRTTKDGGVVVWIVNDSTKKGNESGNSFRQALFFQQIGFNLHDTMIWNKPNCFNFGSNKCYKQAFEYMFVFAKGKIKTMNLIKDVPAKNAGTAMKGGRKHACGKRTKTWVTESHHDETFIVAEFKKRTNVWDMNVGGNNNGHPAVFPEKLAHDHIISWSNEGDLVYDPFMGSGTTAKMALHTNRKYIGSEISEEYCDIIINRC